MPLVGTTRGKQGGKVMISDFGQVIAKVVEVFSIEFTIYGFTFSLWHVFLFDIAASIVIWVLVEVFFK